MHLQKLLYSKQNFSDSSLHAGGQPSIQSRNKASKKGLVISLFHTAKSYKKLFCIQSKQHNTGCVTSSILNSQQQNQQTKRVSIQGKSLKTKLLNVHIHKHKGRPTVCTVYWIYSQIRQLEKQSVGTIHRKDPQLLKLSTATPLSPLDRHDDVITTRSVSLHL